MSEQQLIEIFAPEKYLSINWQVNNFCNFSCSYCNPGNWLGDHKNEEPVEEYIQALSVIINNYKKQDYVNFKFFFSGGEPTAWKNFIPICEWLREELPDCTIAVNTNLTRPLNWWVKHYYLFDDIVASFHIEEANKEKYKEITKFLCNKVDYLSSKMLLHDERFWEVVEFGEELKRDLPNYFIEWTPLYDEMTNDASPWKYLDADKEQFVKEHNVEFEYTVPKPEKNSKSISYNKFADGTVQPTNSNELIVNRRNFFKGWKCSVGDAIFINPAGVVSLASCGQGPTLGMILQDADKIKPMDITCDKYHCYCGTDIIIPKKPEEEVITIVNS